MIVSLGENSLKKESFNVPIRIVILQSFICRQFHLVAYHIFSYSLEPHNWRGISFIKIDLKIISKTLLVKLKKVIPDLIFSQKTAYVTNIHIVKAGD